MEEKVIKDIKMIECSNMWINEKKYYLKLIDTLYNLGYYKDRETIKNIWKKDEH